MNRIIFLSICTFLFVSISSSRQNEPEKLLEPAVKNGKWNYTEKKARKKDITNIRRDRREKNREGDIPISIPTNRPLTQSEKVTLQAIIQDFQVNENVGRLIARCPAIAIDGSGNFVIVWEDQRNDAGDIYAQMYNSSGTTIGNNFRVTAVGDKEQFSPDVKLWNNRIYTTWESNHIAEAIAGIWANALDWDNPTRVEEPVIGNRLSVNGYQLGQNYPNPFNSETTINFAIPIDEYTTMSIYDMNGRLVKTLVSEHKTAGYYSTKWNGKNEKDELVPSGLYLYQMKSGEYNSTKRILLLK